MKNLIALLTFTLSTQAAFATVDANDRAYIVAQNINSEEFFVERVPIIGCYGLNYGPQLAQWTSPYMATSNIGCGGPVASENINYLVCAKVVDAKENADYTGFSEVTLDISQCEAKANPQFITMLRTSAKLNFPLKTGEVKLNLIK